MAGISASIDQLIGVVRALTPNRSPDLPFDCDQDGTGNVLRLEELDGHRTRIFDLRVAIYPVESPVAGLETEEVQTGMELRLVYKVTDDRSYLDRMIAEDIRQILDALLRPGNWATVTTGIVTIDPPGPPRVQQLETNPPGGAVLVVIPFVLTYLES